MLQTSGGADRPHLVSAPGPRPDKRHGRLFVLWILLAGVLGLFAPSGHAQTPVPDGAPRAATAVRTALPPWIDGRMDDAMWGAAEPFTGFVQNEPRDGQPASERTEVHVLFDDEALYIGARMRDSRPAGIVLGESRRDASLDDSDAFRVVLDTFRDRQNGFVFGTNPNGIEYDGQVSREGSGGGGGGGRQQAGSGGGFNLNWDGSWEIATSRDTTGWYAEFRVPFSTLRYGSARTQEWGINFARQIRRRNETAFWSPIPRQFNLYRVSLAGALQEIEPPARRLFTVTPYVLASAERDFFPPESRGTEYPIEFGGDAKLGVTPSLTLDLTLNTDFAQVEVDEQQVNLTRFNLFFPEKRPFFLENAGMFAVGTPQTSELFFSRRIGIARNGEVVPILGGGRLTGKMNGFDVGLLNIQTEEVEGLQPANNYTVARALRELGNRSRIGAIFVNRSATSDLADPASAALQTEDYNRTFGVDGRLGIGSALTLDAYAAATQTPGLNGREYAYKLGGDYESRDWRGSLDFRVVGDAFNPEVGFLDRRGYRFGSGSIMHYIRPEAISWLREIRPHITYRGFWDFDGFQETGYLHVDSHFEAPNGAFFSPAFNWTREGLKEPFEISDSVIVLPGTYDNWEAAWRFNTDESAALSLEGGIDVGGFYSGTRRGGNVSITGRQGSALAGVLRLSHDIVDLPEGEFDVTLIGLRLAYAFTPRIFVQSLVQYGSQSETWSGNLRFGWLNTAGTGLFVVYNERQRIRDWEDDNGILNRQGPLDRALILKFTRQFDIRL